MEGYPVGTRRRSKAGYIQVKTGSLRAPLWESEGRLVMERHLGRRLTHDEQVKHKRGVPHDDNRLEGLELWRAGRPVRIRRGAARRRRTNWKRLYLEAVTVLEDIAGDPATTATLDDAQRDAVEGVFARRP